MTALFEDSEPRDRAVSRKEATRLLRQVTTGVGALLLAAVDDWNALSERHAAHLRTELHGLLRGSHVAALTAASTAVWLSTQGMHPPGHIVSKPHRWPMISSHGKTYMAIHHYEMEPTNARRTAFCNQDSETLRLIDAETSGLIGNPTHCELTWDYDPYTDAHIRRIWVSAPSVDWDRFDFARLLQAASTDRDRLLLSALYDLGLRVGQALGLRHSDLDLMRRRVRVCRREDNANGALSKQRAQFTVDAPRRFFDLYAAYLLGEITDVDSDYVFVNLSRRPRGGPLSYSNAYQLVERIGAAAGIDDLHPHMLRHTHATALARAGWTAAEIAARLGQSHASSADVYIHLAGDDLAERLRRTEHLVWRAPQKGAGDATP